MLSTILAYDNYILGNISVSTRFVLVITIWSYPDFLIRAANDGTFIHLQARFQAACNKHPSDVKYCIHLSNIGDSR